MKQKKYAITTLLVLCSLLKLSCFGMETKNHYVDYIDALYKQSVNPVLISISQTDDPVALIKKAEEYYVTQSAANKSLLAYFKNSGSNFQKIWTYIKLSSEIYDEKDGNSIWHEWPLISVKHDFIEQKKRIGRIKNRLDVTFQELPTQDQPSSLLQEKNRFLANAITALDRAITICDYKDIEECELSDFINLIDPISIEVSMKKLHKQYDLKTMNSRYQDKNDANSLFHALCDSNFTHQQLDTIIGILVNHVYIDISEPNKQGQTPLAYAISKNMDNEYIEVIKKYVQPKKSILKRSTDS